MPYCPECKFEYRPDINKCPDCDAWLVASLNKDAGQSPTGGAVVPAQPPAPIQYSKELQKIIDSLPAGPTTPSRSAIPQGPLSPGSNRSNRGSRNREPDSDSEVARKLDQYQTWIEIAHFPTEEISNLVSEALESVGVPCVIMPGTQSQTHLGRAFGGAMRTYGNDILLVPEEFVERADLEITELIGQAYEEFKTPNS